MNRLQRVIHALCLAVRDLEPMPQQWSWGTVALMGQRTIRGRFTDPREPTCDVEEWHADGSVTRSTVGRSALYQATQQTEAEVRETVAAHGNPHALRYPCAEGFQPSPVWPARCAKCGATEAQHAAKQRKRAADAAVGATPLHAYVDTRDLDDDVARTVVVHTNVGDEARSFTVSVNSDKTISVCDCTGKTETAPEWISAAVAAALVYVVTDDIPW